MTCRHAELSFVTAPPQCKAWYIYMPIIRLRCCLFQHCLLVSFTFLQLSTLFLPGSCISQQQCSFLKTVHCSIVCNFGKIVRVKAPSLPLFLTLPSHSLFSLMCMWWWWCDLVGGCVTDNSPLSMTGSWSCPHSPAPVVCISRP